MGDRLVWLLNRFELGARVFQSGPLCHTARFDAQDGLGYLHVLRHGALRVETPSEPALLIDDPSLFFYMNPTSHRLLPQGENVDMVCASFDFGAGLRNPLARALPGVVLLRLSDMPTLRTSLELLFKEAAEQHCGRQAVLDRLIEIIIVQLLRDLMNQNRLEAGLCVERKTRLGPSSDLPPVGSSRPARRPRTGATSLRCAIPRRSADRRSAGNGR